MVSIPMQCLAQSVHKKVRDEVHNVVNDGLLELEKIEKEHKLTDTDYEMIKLIKDYGKTIRRMVDNLPICEEK